MLAAGFVLRASWATSPWPLPDYCLSFILHLRDYRRHCSRAYLDRVRARMGRDSGWRSESHRHCRRDGCLLIPAVNFGRSTEPVGLCCRRRALCSFQHCFTGLEPAPSYPRPTRYSVLCTPLVCVVCVRASDRRRRAPAKNAQRHAVAAQPSATCLAITMNARPRQRSTFPVPTPPNDMCETLRIP